MQTRDHSHGRRGLVVQSLAAPRSRASVLTEPRNSEEEVDGTVEGVDVESGFAYQQSLRADGVVATSGMHVSQVQGVPGLNYNNHHVQQSASFHGSVPPSPGSFSQSSLPRPVSTNATASMMQSYPSSMNLASMAVSSPQQQQHSYRGPTIHPLHPSQSPYHPRTSSPPVQSQYSFQQHSVGSGFAHPSYPASASPASPLLNPYSYHRQTLPYAASSSSRSLSTSVSSTQIGGVGENQEPDYVLDAVFVAFRTMENIKRRSCLNWASSLWLKRFGHCELIFRTRLISNPKDVSNHYTCVVYEETGVCFHKKKNYLESLQNWEIKRIRCTLQNMELAYKFCDKMKGRGYDSAKVRRNFIGRIVPKETDEEKWICSELIAHVLKYYLCPGLLESWQPHLMVPDEIYDGIRDAGIVQVDALDPSVLGRSRQQNDANRGMEVV